MPLLAVQTADPAGIVRLALREAVNGTTAPVLLWDCIHGITPGNTAAEELAGQLNQNTAPAIATGNPVEALRAIEQLGATTGLKPIVVMLGLSEILDDPQSKTPARQALWNLRDVLPPSGTLLVFTTPLGWRNPFPNDIAVAEESLPNRVELARTVERTATDAKVPVPNDAELEAAADALIGLSGFAAEQATALSLSKSGLDISGLWSRKRQQIAETPGLSVYDGQESFADLGGLDQAKDLFGRVMNSRRKPGAVVFIDEIEKSLAGAGGDTSGVSQSMLGYRLSYMQDNNATGSILIGPPGSGKSAFAKAVGNQGKVPTITLDLGGLKGSLVGESEGRTRAALAVITAVSAGRPMFLATCNSIGNLPPELRRRFTLGTMFFDLPSEAERKAIWNLYAEKYARTGKDIIPKSDGWTGAEIRQCVDLADRLGCNLMEAAKFVVPVSISAREQIERLRSEASGRYLSAGDSGIYQRPQQKTAMRAVEA